jgi:hypothetical protein
MAIVVDGKLTVPLYHGTNELFYESIKEHGFGGLDIIKELHVVEVLRELLTICKERLSAHVEDRWIGWMTCADFIAGQNVTASGANFRHGSVYLTAADYKAMSHATAYETGSEILECFMMIWKRLQEHQIDIPESVLRRSQRILEFASGGKCPLLFVLNSVPISILAAEDGGDVKSVFASPASILSEDPKFFGVMCQSLNFELLQPMPISEIKVFRMVKDNSSEQDQYSVVPYEPHHISGVNFTATDGRRWVRDNGWGYGKWVEF